MRDITSLKRSHERLMHDAVHDSLTSLPNRELFMDRLQGAITRAREGKANRPTVMFIDIDRFKNVNKSFGLAVGDSMLLTLGRRLSRHLNPQDTLARLGGDQFAILMISETDPRQVATLAERVRRALRTPMKIGGKEIVLTASIGIVVDDGVQAAAQDFLREGEIAMLRAKRAGADRIEIFTASMRGEDESRLPLESDLRKALEKRQLAVLVSADHPPRLEPACRLRGAAPLGSSDARPARPRRVRAHRRGGRASSASSAAMCWVRRWRRRAAGTRFCRASAIRSSSASTCRAASSSARTSCRRSG